MNKTLILLGTLLILVGALLVALSSTGFVTFGDADGALSDAGASPESTAQTPFGPTTPPTATPAPSSTPTLVTSTAPTPAPTQSASPSPVPTSSPEPTEPPQVMDGVSFFEGKQPNYVRNDCVICRPSDYIHLTNNDWATDPTWAELEAFLVADLTDENAYVPGSYVCGSFAEDVHNNAEAAGIRAAWVALEFAGDGEGHACNAFQTADRGLVYVDCTGDRPGDEADGGDSSSWDKVAYIAVDEVYGLVSLDVMSCPGYGCYEEYAARKAAYEQDLDDYNEAVAVHNGNVTEFNEWVDGKMFIQGTPDAERMQQWYDALAQDEAELAEWSAALSEERDALGTFWVPMGAVSSVEVYW